MEYKNVYVPTLLKVQFDIFFRESQIIVFSSFFGFGKKHVSRELIKNYKSFDIIYQDGIISKLPSGYEVYYLEGLENITDEKQQEILVKFINSQLKSRFVFVTNYQVPRWLLPFYIDNRLETIERKLLVFSDYDVQNVFDIKNLAITPKEIDLLHTDFGGYPLAIMLVTRYLEVYGGSVNDALPQITGQLYKYTEDVIFKLIGDEFENFLMQISPFKTFNLELARKVSKREDIQIFIDMAIERYIIFQKQKLDEFSFYPFIIKFINRKWLRTHPAKEIEEVYLNAGIYYDSIGDISNALNCYKLSNKQDMVINLLEKYAQFEPHQGYFYKLEKNYLSLPEEKVLQSPELMYAFSMIYSMRTNYEKSNYWYKKLEEYVSKIPKNDPRYRKVESVLLRLSVSLPHSSNNILISNISKIIKNKTLMSVSITSGLPSVLNGGKDFSDWVKKDDIFYRTLKKPIEIAFGKAGIGICECGICESKFEKDENYEEQYLKMMSILSKVQKEDMYVTEFAIIGVSVRVHISQGRLHIGKQMLESLRDKYKSLGEYQILENIDAYLCYLALLTGDEETVKNWTVKNPPEFHYSIWTMFRYQYFILVEAWIQQKNYLEALTLLTLLLNYSEECKKTIDKIQIYSLMAICHYRMHNESWKEDIAKALDIAYEYKYIRIIAKYGMAIFSLLSECDWKKDEIYLGKIIKSSRGYAELYRKYLEPKILNYKKLTKAELGVLNLICQDCSNSQIADILGIKLTTVKTHVSNVLRKLDVSRRSEAKSVAKKMNLSMEYIDLNEA